MTNNQNHDHLAENRNSAHGMLTGMFRDRDSTQDAYNSLHERGYTDDEISLLMSDKTRKEHFSDEVEYTEIGTKAAEGAGKGSAIGGTVGAIAGVIVKPRNDEDAKYFEENWRTNPS